MEVVRGLYNLQPRHHGCVLAIGNFDGVHLGHQALLAALQTASVRHGVPAFVQSFRPSARAWFDPASAPPAVLPLRDNIRALAAAGVACWSCLRFDARFAEFAAQDYIDQVLCDALGVRAVVVGADFRFGAGRAGDVAMLRAAGEARGFEVVAVDEVSVGDARVSSTRLRERLADGDVETVKELLARPYSLSGIVRHGQALGRKLGTATANMAFRESLALRFGVYAVTLHCADQQWPGVANFGVRPTVGSEHPLLEAHALADTESLYGRELRTEFHHFIRAERRFASLEALSEQIRADIEAARNYLGLQA